MALPLLPRRSNWPPHEGGTGPRRGLPPSSHITHHAESNLMPPKNTTTRTTQAYKNWVKEVLDNCEPVCYRCGQPVDMTLPRNSKWGGSAEHTIPLAESGDLTPSLADSAISHLHCNRSHGGKLGAQRAAAEKQSKSSPKKNGFLKDSLPTPSAPSRNTP
jgi:hypothetical protein